MQAEDALVALGEVAAAFAGFSGVVAALGTRSVSEWPAAARFRFANLLVISVAAALFAFLPVALGQFPVASRVVWGWSSATLCLFAGSLLVSRWAEGRRIGAKEPASLRLWVAISFLVILTSVGTIQIANVAAWPWKRSGAPYVAGVFGLLVLSGLQFISLALASAPAEPADPPA